MVERLHMQLERTDRYLRFGKARERGITYNKE